MNELKERIAAEILKDSVISFERFMEMALYEPGLGYYETHRDIGRQGDFYTNVSIGPLFGQLLGFQFAQWLQLLRGPVQLVEAGAHDGRLAADILNYLREFQSAIYERVTLILLEQSQIHREWQAETLAEHAAKVQWEGEKSKPFRGVFYCNELLDAFPVQKYEWDEKGRTWFEWGVEFENGQFVWRRLREDAWSCEFADQLPDGTGMIEAPQASQFWLQICNALEEGRAVAIDYFVEREDFFNPPTPHATLRGYYQHRRSDDLLANSGKQDLTASVDLNEIRDAARTAGIESKKLTSQGKFFVSIFQKTLEIPAQFPEWKSERLRQFQTLTHPDHLGRAFSVLENWRR